MDLRGNKGRKSAEIFTSAMNDIMFFLMLFFIILSTLFNTDLVKVNLPGTHQKQERDQRKEIVVTINDRGFYYLNEKELSYKDLTIELKQLVEKNSSEMVIVRCDSSLSVQQLMSVLELGHQYGVKMFLATKPVAKK